MAGFSQIGESGYGINPPMVTQPVGASGYTPLSIRRPIRTYSPYFTPQQYQMPTGADTSAQHQANMYLAQSGLGDTGQTRQEGLADYGFSADDWQHIQNYLNNPQDQNNINNYMDITKRLGNIANTNPMFSMWQPEQRQSFSTDFPIRLASGYGLVPPPVLQSWGMPYPSSATNNLRF